MHEIAVFLWDEFCAQVTFSSLKRAFALVDWFKEVAPQRAKERVRIYEAHIMHNLSDVQSYHLVYAE